MLPLAAAVATKWTRGIENQRQAGEKWLAEEVRQGGLTRFRRAAETPFNLILEARP